MRLPNAVGQWNWRELSMVIPIGDIRARPDLPWDREGLSMNKGMTVEAMDYLDQVMTSATGEWDWYDLSQDIPISDIRAHPDLPWNRYSLSENDEITVEAVSHLDQVMTSATGEWNWRVLSRVVPIGDIRLHPGLPWNRTGLSLNKDITVEAMNHLVKVMTNATGQWDWESLSRVIPIGNIRLHHNLPWDREGLSQNKDITLALMDELDEVLTYAVGEWNWYDLSQYIPMSDIRARPDLPWDKWMLNINPSITVDDVVYMDIGDRIDYVVSMEEIKANPHWSWSKQRMSMNPSITMEMVMANPDD